MARLEDLLPPGTEAEWTCGHIGGAVCKKCYEELARKANQLAQELDLLRELLEDATRNARSRR